MIGPSERINLTISIAPDGNVSVTGPINDPDLCFGLISEGMKLILMHKHKDNQNESGIIVPSKRFDV